MSPMSPTGPKGAAPRPVTFTFNGGPGSSSMWLHMGSIGPVLVETPTAGSTAPAPYRIRNNPETMLDKTDIVFLDAIGTGLSRPIGKSKGPEFWGVDQDIDAFARGIMRYLTINDRWDSPKFLFGESYGTLRGAGLVYALQQRGVQMNGVVLLSSILNYGVRQPGYDQIYLTYLPTYAATAWYHNRLPNKPAALEPFLTEVRQWTTGPYASALAKGSDLGDEERNAVAQQMSAYTGLSVKYILDADLARRAVAVPQGVDARPEAHRRPARFALRRHRRRREPAKVPSLIPPMRRSAGRTWAR